MKANVYCTYILTRIAFYLPQIPVKLCLFYDNCNHYLKRLDFLSEINAVKDEEKFGISEHYML